MPNSVPLPRKFYNRSPEIVACELIGKLLLRQSRLGFCGGRIVEAEAYLAANDAATEWTYSAAAASFGELTRGYFSRARTTCTPA